MNSDRFTSQQLSKQYDEVKDRMESEISPRRRSVQFSDSVLHREKTRQKAATPTINSLDSSVLARRTRGADFENSLRRDFSQSHSTIL